MYTYIYIYIL